jgi:hypothetical protein
VRERISPELEEPDEILDDVFVLWRAFEATWNRVSGESDRGQAERAVTATIGVIDIRNLPGLQRLIGAMRPFQFASPGECAEWFPHDRLTPAEIKSRVTTQVRRLQAALQAMRWHDSDSRSLALLVYKIRCAVVHPSLDTTNDLARSVLPALREALIELTIARTACSYGLSLSAARRHFDLRLS